MKVVYVGDGPVAVEVRLTDGREYVAERDGDPIDLPESDAKQLLEQPLLWQPAPPPAPKTAAKPAAAKEA